jgi:hypothetical protein
MSFFMAINLPAAELALCKLRSSESVGRGDNDGEWLLEGEWLRLLLAESGGRR